MNDATSCLVKQLNTDMLYVVFEGLDNAQVLFSFQKCQFINRGSTLSRNNSVSSMKKLKEIVLKK